MEVDVAIVGCGPAGVVLAALLGKAGLRVHICDRLSGVYEIPRAISLDHEILRVFQQLGVVDRVMPFTEPFTNSEFFGVDGHYVRNIQFGHFYGDWAAEAGYVSRQFWSNMRYAILHCRA
jgi:2-polyprenyl-6-methoxyphenol hydroxylase-like FAD-dependent oxidoreductase